MHLLVITDIAADGVMLAPEMIQFFQRLIGGVAAAEIINSHVRASGRQFQRHAFAYAFGSPGYQGYFAFELPAHLTPLSEYSSEFCSVA
jgi:hypothetical protein